MVTAVWGWTFVLVKDAITQYPVLPFLELRFLLAALVMAVIVHRLPTREGTSGVNSICEKSSPFAFQ